MLSIILNLTAQEKTLSHTFHLSAVPSRLISKCSDRSLKKRLSEINRVQLNKRTWLPSAAVKSYCSKMSGRLTDADRQRHKWHIVSADSEMYAVKWKIKVSGRGRGRGGRGAETMHVCEAETTVTQRGNDKDGRLRSAGVSHPSHFLSVFIFLYPTVFHLNLLLRKNTSWLNRFQKPISLCVHPPPHTTSSRAWSRLLTLVFVSFSPTRTEAQSHRASSPLSLSLSHLQFALNTLLPSPIPPHPPASFYFSVSSWQQHHIIRLNPRANMPPHLNRPRRMRAATALQTHLLQSVFF